MDTNSARAVDQVNDESRADIDAFLAYNDHEPKIVEINAWLETEGFKTRYLRRAVKLSGSGDESVILGNPASVVVFLGDAGWGPSHLALTLGAQLREMPFILVCIGNPPDSAFDECNGLFRHQDYIDLRMNENAGLVQLRNSILRLVLERSLPIRPDQASDTKTEELIRGLVDGNEARRRAILSAVHECDAAQRTALAIRLLHEISGPFGPSAEREISSAIRDPRRIASVRSWMLSVLIACSAEQEETRSLVDCNS